MRRISLWLLVITLAGAGLVEAAKIKTHADPAADFASFHTFAWQRAEGPSPEDLDRPIRAAAEAELAEHGLRPARADETPDLLIAYNAGLADALAAGFSITAGWWGNLVAIPAEDSNVTAGLLFALSRPEGGEPVWTGILTQRATVENALVVLRKRAPGLVRKLLGRYPN